MTRSQGALRAQTSTWRPFGPLNFVLRALWVLRQCDPRRKDQTIQEILKSGGQKYCHTKEEQEELRILVVGWNLMKIGIFLCIDIPNETLEEK